MKKGLLLVHLTLSDKRLIDVQQDITALNDHPLYGQVLSDVLCFTYFIMHNLQNNTDRLYQC